MIKTFANKFKNADEAFQYWYQCIEYYGTEFAGTKALFNIGFEMSNPTDNSIKQRFRDWKQDYAEAEWQWYLTGDRSIIKLGDIYGKIPQIWQRMANPEGEVNSNYGWQGKRKNQ